MSHRFKPKYANEQYARLREYADHRTSEITTMLKPFTDITEKYGRLLCRICLIVGEEEPRSTQDAVVRDLMADVFDFLYEAEHFVQKGQAVIAFPLARRAYESLSLLHCCVLDESMAEYWHKGKKIGNHEIRKALAAHPMGESEAQLKELYNFFCSMAHPNREMIAFRGLGEGNSFVFGSIGAPNLIVLVDYCLKILDLWFWFCPTLTYFYRERVFARDRTFHNAHNEARKAARETSAWLVEQFNNLLEEWKSADDIIQPKFS